VDRVIKAMAYNRQTFNEYVGKEEARLLEDLDKARLAEKNGQTEWVATRKYLTHIVGSVCTAVGGESFENGSPLAGGAGGAGGAAILSDDLRIIGRDFATTGGESVGIEADEETGGVQQSFNVST